MIKLYTFSLLLLSIICTSQSLKLNYEIYGIKYKTSEKVNNEAGYVEFYKDKIKFEQNGQIQIMAINKFLNNNHIALKNSGEIYFETLDKNELLVLELNNVRAYFYFTEKDKQSFIIFYKNEFSELTLKSSNDCGCKNFEMDNIILKQCKPELVASDKNYQITFAVSDIENIKYIILTIIFLNSGSSVVNSDLMIFTTEDNVVNLQLLDTTKDFVGGREISHAKYELTIKNFEILKLEKITDIRFTIANDEIHKSHKIKQNNDVLFNQLNCLK